MNLKYIAATAVVGLLVGVPVANAAGAKDLITGKDVKNGSVMKRDLSPGVRAKLDAAGAPHATGATGATGAKGETGPAGQNGIKGDQGFPGAKGEPGRDGVSGYEVRTFDYPQVGPGGVATVACGDDEEASKKKVAVGGGFYIRNGNNPDMSSNMDALSNGAGVVASFPGRMDWSTNTPKPNRNDGWIVRFNSKPAGAVTLYAICMNAA